MVHGQLNAVGRGPVDGLAEGAGFPVNHFGPQGMVERHGMAAAAPLRLRGHHLDITQALNGIDQDMDAWRMNSIVIAHQYTHTRHVATGLGPPQAGKKGISFPLFIVSLIKQAGPSVSDRALAATVLY